MNHLPINEGAQINRTLKYLTDNPHGLNRFIGESELNILHLAPRICALRALGYLIDSILEDTYDRDGRPHPNVARYVLTGYIDPNLQSEAVA